MDLWNKVSTWEVLMLPAPAGQDAGSEIVASED
jgi:hypothetical protein